MYTVGCLSGKKGWDTWSPPTAQCSDGPANVRSIGCSISQCSFCSGNLYSSICFVWSRFCCGPFASGRKRILNWLFQHCYCHRRRPRRQRRRRHNRRRRKRRRRRRRRCYLHILNASTSATIGTVRSSVRLQEHHHPFKHDVKFLSFDSDDSGLLDDNYLQLIVKICHSYTWLNIPYFSKKIPLHWTQNLVNI